MQTFLLYMIKSSTILIVLLTYYQFFLNIAVLLAMSLVMFGITIFSIRRQRHESL